ncbi:hypothetical protein J2X76_005952 [Neorhizobium sp. 2083]|nr:hypothetical protein [Neorhizobium sp. 2083]
MEPFIFRDGGVFVLGLFGGVMLFWLHRKLVYGLWLRGGVG